MKIVSSCLLNLLLILIISFSEARHLRGKISDAATRTSKSLDPANTSVSINDNAVLKGNNNSISEKAHTGNNKKTKKSFNPRVEEFESRNNIVHEHSGQPNTVLPTAKQSAQNREEIKSFITKKVEHVNMHHPNEHETISNDNALSDRNSDNSVISTASHINQEPHDISKENHLKSDSKTLGSSLKSMTENDAVIVSKDDSNRRLRPTVTVFIDEKNVNGRTHRVIASSGDGVIKSKKVHIDESDLDSNDGNGHSSNHMINTNKSSKHVENNKMSHNVLSHNGIKGNVAENSNVPLNVVEHNTVSGNIVKDKNLSDNEVENSDVPAEIVEHNSAQESVIVEQSDASDKIINNIDSSYIDQVHNDVSPANNLHDTGDYVEPSKILQHDDISVNTINVNEASSNEVVQDDNSSNDRESHKISSNDIESHKISSNIPTNNVLLTGQTKNDEELQVVKENSLKRVEVENETSTNSQDLNESYVSKIAPTMAVFENAHGKKVSLKNTEEEAEAIAQDLHNVDTTDTTAGEISVADTTVQTTDFPKVMTTSMSRKTITDTTVTPKITTTVAPTVRRPEDVTPLDIFTSDIKYQRFPRPMSLTTLKNEVLGKPLKKLYILEESEKKLFQHVRQLEAIYTIEDGILYVSFLFRFIYSRKCQEIEKFKMGKIVGNTDIAMFEKEMKDGKTERIMFFSERPEDYVFFMSCTDMKTSPYACRDSYYVTLDTTHDPPNQFPWADAANELESKLSITFEDPRFIFNFVLMPCARRS